MDFLDPRKKRSRNIRLAVGYCLVAIAIGLATVILVYAAYGYGIDTKTGGVVQNGLLFVDSKPGGAEIFLNGQDHNSTSAARLVLAAGNYTLTLKRSGYRDWQRSFALDEHSIARYIYPFLFPVKPTVTVLKNYGSAPPLVTESPDQHWLIVQEPSTDPSTVTFDEVDTTALSKPIQALSVPSGLLTADGQPVKLSVVEWSTDNNHVLLAHPYAGGTEYIIFNRSDPTQSINVNKTFQINPGQIALRNKKISQLYIYNQDNQTLQIADTGKSTVAVPLLRQVLAFKSYGSNLVVYVTNKDMPSGQVQARIWDGSTSYPLYNFAAGTQYFVDTAQFQGHSYFIAGSNQSDRIDIFQDPLSDLKDPSIAKAVPLVALNEPGAKRVSFSTNARFAEAENGQSFAVYDFENQEYYGYTLDAPLAAPLTWMDGHRLMGESGGNVFVTDYDSTNQQMVTSSVEADGGFFSRDFNHLFTLQAKSDGSIDLANVDMRAGTDLPKNP